jgi:hypothetical protein
MVCSQVQPLSEANSKGPTGQVAIKAQEGARNGQLRAKCKDSGRHYESPV